MKKYALLITIGSLFLGTQLPAMDKGNVSEYEKTIKSAIRQATPSLVDPNTGAFPFQIETYHNFAMKLAPRFGLNDEKAHRIYVNAVLDLIMEVQYNQTYFMKEFGIATPEIHPDYKLFKERLMRQIEAYIEG